MKYSFYHLHMTSLFLFGILLLITSCSTPKHIYYFQDLEPGMSELKVVSPLEIKIRPEDKISILVNSRDPMLADLFNLPIISRQVGQTGYKGTTQGISGYTVDMEGNIDFPVLGKIHVEGKNRDEIAAYIKNELIVKNLIKDPVVTVEYLNLTISILGEVNNPGRYNIDRDKITLLDALSLAGDLTIYGKREKVIVLREENDLQHFYTVDLGSAQNLYSSPGYYLQQNDVVYVEPNSVRARQSTVNGNNVRSTSFWISLTSLLTSLVTTITVFTK